MISSNICGRRQLGRSGHSQAHVYGFSFWPNWQIIVGQGLHSHLYGFRTEKGGQLRLHRGTSVGLPSGGFMSDRPEFSGVSGYSSCAFTTCRIDCHVNLSVCLLYTIYM